MVGEERWRPVRHVAKKCVTHPHGLARKQQHSDSVVAHGGPIVGAPSASGKIKSRHSKWGGRRPDLSCRKGR